ncbi:MAG: rhodanese-like domain-containing protein [Prevotella sp.]|nr:rhodanese-like domain-containing protein [Prevotella sp.]
MYKTLFLLAIVIIVVIACANAKVSQGNDKVLVVTPANFKDALDKDSTIFLLDVRTADEYAEGHLKGAQLLDWKQTEAFKEGAKAFDKAKTVYVYCRSGRRSNAAAHYLAEEGFTVVDMDGGILAWTSNGFPTVSADE